MIPKIPAAACDPGHAELIIIGLVILLIIMARLWWKERQDGLSKEAQWKERVEEKLDVALSAHIECQKNLPFTYVTKNDFKTLNDYLREISNDRTKIWNTFTDKFDVLMDKFGKHRHDENRKVDV
jgi:hypothetical protein